MFNEKKPCVTCNTTPKLYMLGGTRFSFAMLSCKCKSLESPRTKSSLTLEEKTKLVNALIKAWNKENKNSA